MVEEFRQITEEDRGSREEDSRMIEVRESREAEA